MTPRHRIRLSSPADIASFVPYLLGFHPHQHIVTLALHEHQVLFAVAIHLLRQHDVDAVAREDEAGDGALCGDGHGDGAHARPEGRGQKTTIARLDERALGQRLTGRHGKAHDGALQRLRIRVVLQVIGALDELLRPGLEAHHRRIQDRADRQRLGGDEHLRAVDRRRRVRGGHRRGRAHHQGARHERGDRGDEQRSHQKDDLPAIHDAS